VEQKNRGPWGVGREASAFHAPPPTLDAPRFLKPVALALAATVGQILLACCASGQINPAEAYASLFHWDAGWYGCVVEKGYQLPAAPNLSGETNLAFFPAYPLLARFLKSILHARLEYALLLAAQLGCWGFWTYVFLFCQRWRASGSLTLVGVLAVLIHPGSFFLVVGYSEPLFLMAVLGFLFWSAQRPSWRGFVGVAHGFVMTATRFVGVPLIIVPLCWRWFNMGATQGGSWAAGEGWWVPRIKRSVPFLTVAALASFGALSFFGFCEWRFGEWDAYFKANELGWGIKPQYSALFSTRIFHVHYPDWSKGVCDPEFLSRLWVPLTLSLFGALAFVELRLARGKEDSGWRDRIGFYVAAWLLFYVPSCSHAGKGMSSMIRFTLCVQILLMLAMVHMLARRPVPARWQRLAIGSFALWSLISFSFQMALTYRFTHGNWVA
jgi:hypothetical protein